MKKRNLMIALLLAVLLTFSACTQGTGSTASSAGADDSVAVTVNEADYFSDRDRSGAWDESKALMIVGDFHQLVYSIRPKGGEGAVKA